MADNQEPKGDQEPKTVTLKPGEKIYTQEQLDAAFKSRFAQVKEADEQAFNEKLKGVTTELETLKRAGADKETADKALNSTHEQLIKLVPEDMRDLIPTHGSKSEQLEWIIKNQARLIKPVQGEAPPPTPKPSAEGKPIPPAAAPQSAKLQIPQQYSSMAEWQMNDPAGCSAAIKASKT